CRIGDGDRADAHCGGQRDGKDPKHRPTSSVLRAYVGARVQADVAALRSRSSPCAVPAHLRRDENELLLVKSRIKLPSGRRRLAWGGVEFLRFGPMATTGRPERFDFWPDPRGFTDRQLRTLIAQRDPAALDPATLEKKSVAVQGLTVLEILLTDSAHPLDATNE